MEEAQFYDLTIFEARLAALAQVLETGTGTARFYQETASEARGLLEEILRSAPSSGDGSSWDGRSCNNMLIIDGPRISLQASLAGNNLTGLIARAGCSSWQVEYAPGASAGPQALAGDIELRVLFEQNGAILARYAFSRSQGAVNEHDYTEMLNEATKRSTESLRQAFHPPSAEPGSSLPASLPQSQVPATLLERAALDLLGQIARPGAASPVPRKAAWQLVVMQGPDAGQVFILAEQAHIGRGKNNEITLNDPQVSRRHALIQVEGDTCSVRDLKSSNGTFVNDFRITQPARLRSGDILRVGDSILMVKVS
jgi:hypothetical protein